jgi:hypothetical protein
MTDQTSGTPLVLSSSQGSKSDASSEAQKFHSGLEYTDLRYMQYPRMTADIVHELKGGECGSLS